MIIRIFSLTIDAGWRGNTGEHNKPISPFQIHLLWIQKSIIDYDFTIKIEYRYIEKTWNEVLL